MSEHRRKTLRSFYCEETLWQSFEKRAREGDATIDQLLNEALRQYLEGPPAAAPGAPAMAAPAAAAPAPAAPVSAAQPIPTGPSPRPRRASEDRPVATDAPTHAMPAAPQRAPVPPPPPSGPAMAPPPAPSAAPPRPAAAPAPAPGGGMPPLFLHYGGRAYPVQKERFVIGRGSQGTDLTIRDGNVSRKHAAVIFHSGAFYIQDLGSTNGVEFQGNRVDAKKIDEADVFYICDHELSFSYRG